MEICQFEDEFDPRFKIFHELMPSKIREILLVSSLYDAFIMEEDCRLAERIIYEYRGLNLSQPPRLTWVSSAEEALAAVAEKPFTLVITMPRLADMDAFVLGQELKKKIPDLPVMLLTHGGLTPDLMQGPSGAPGIDRVFVWTGNTDLLVAIIKSVEDGMNVAHDTQIAGVRVILFVEDSPYYMSMLLPILYREVVSQTQAVMQLGLNEEHKLLTMRARAKILVAQNYEEAVTLFQQYKPYMLGVVSDVRFPRAGRLDREAGIELLTGFRNEIHDLPILLTSSEASNKNKAQAIGASFIDKNSESLGGQIHNFFLDYLGFGEFVFRMPDGSELARISRLRSFENILPSLPKESFIYHGNRNDFSRWLFARSEILLAQHLRPLSFDDFNGDVEKMRQYIVSTMAARRKWKQKGLVVNFDREEFDPATEITKIGKGSLGGKARGLAFLSTLLQRHPDLHRKYPGLEIMIPRSLVLTTDVFDAFIEAGGLRHLARVETSDEEMARHFLEVEFPQDVAGDLKIYLQHVRQPLAVRSSGLLEDAQFKAYAGLYRTYMLPNDHPDIEARLEQLITAVKLVFASTFFQGPKAFARRVGQRTEDEKMAVIIQEMIGNQHNGFFYPAISGVAQSHNFYPFDRMKPEDGIATIALGLGRTVVEGGRALRFSPKHPQLLPQFSTVDDWLRNSQREFYVLKMGRTDVPLGISDLSTLAKREINSAREEPPLSLVASTYIPEEHRIKDSTHLPGQLVITFAPVLKYRSFPLAELLSDMLHLIQTGMGTAVEIEFTAHLCRDEGCNPALTLLQIRPMSARPEVMTVEIQSEEIEQAFCYSAMALGNTERRDIVDIIYVKPAVFDPGRTVEIAQEIGRLNRRLGRENGCYLLVGPGRWGSADPWLGIPVQWADISEVCAMVETTLPQLKAQPSQGSHFFHNVTTLGICYLTVREGNEDFFRWDWLTSQAVSEEGRYAAHVRLENPLTLKVNGRKSAGVIYV